MSTFKYPVISFFFLMRLKIILFPPSYQLQNIPMNLLKALSDSIHGLFQTDT